MPFIEHYGKELVALAVPLITWALATFFKARARLLLAVPHAFTFSAPPIKDAEGKETATTIRTRSIVLSNAGREAATGVELVFRWKPLINIWPNRHYDPTEGENGAYVMKFASLAPGENLGCELVSFNTELPDLLTARSDQCTAQNISMYPQPVVPTWKKRLGMTLMLGGMGTTVYLT